MRTARLQTICACLSDHHQMLPGKGGPKVNYFEQVSSDGHQISQAGGSRV